MSLLLGLMLCLALFSTQDTFAQAKIVDFNGNVLDEHEEEEPWVNETDSLALVSFYHATGGDNWFNNSGWLEDPVYSWFGIHTVEEVEPGEWRVIRVDLTDNGLTGSPPEDIIYMEHVWRFEIRNNQMTGPFPEAFFSAPRMRFARMNHNYFTGEIPWDVVYNNEVVSHLLINNNQFEGSLPDIEEGQLPRLANFEVANNMFTGDIPLGWEHLPAIRRIRMQNCRFEGSLENFEGVTEAARLDYFQVDRNYSLDPGPIPEWLRDLGDEEMARLHIDGTNRTGEIPDWFGEMIHLERLQLGGGDEIGGALPVQMTNLLNLERFYLYGPDGNFSGEIPDWLGLMNIERIRFHDQDFHGQIPDNWGQSSLEHIELRNLELDGPLPNMVGLNLEVLRLDNIGFELEEIPSWVGDQIDLEELRLVRMGITGDLPEFLGNLNELEVVEFDDNPITGEIPGWIRSLENLEALRLSRTNMDVPEFPTWLQNHDELRHIELAGLGIGGEIPGWIGSFQWLSTLALDDNEFTGEIPWQIGNLVFLDSLNLAHNQLQGELPVSFPEVGVFEGVTNLNSVVLSGNEELEGEFPMAVTENWNPDITRVVWFDDTKLCKPDNETFSDWLDAVAEPWNPEDEVTKVSVQSSGIVCGEDTFGDTPDRPFAFRLEQNYPNPFNPVTTIQYEIPAGAHVTLRIYNVIGQRVATLVNEHQESGRYDVNFDAIGLASGSYIYRLEAGDRVQTQTMTLLK